VVVVRRAEQLKGDGGDLDAYLEDPTPGVTLVLQAGKPDKRRAVWKRLLKKVAVKSAEPLKGRRLSGYVADQLRKRQLQLGPDGLEELIQRVGQDLRRLMGEVDKLESYAQGQTLSGEDVSEILGRGMGQPIYKLTDAFMVRRRDEALKLLDAALEDREPGLRLLASLHYTLRRLRIAKELGRLGRSGPELASQLGVPPFKVRDVMNAARQWSQAGLAAALVALQRADLRIKTGTADAVALTAALVEACGEAVRPPLRLPRR
jgi:DNA polymerase-3 subunit delta